MILFPQSHSVWNIWCFLALRKIKSVWSYWSSSWPLKPLSTYSTFHCLEPCHASSPKSPPTCHFCLLWQELDTSCGFLCLHTHHLFTTEYIHNPPDHFLSRALPHPQARPYSFSCKHRRHVHMYTGALVCLVCRLSNVGCRTGLHAPPAFGSLWSTCL